MEHRGTYGGEPNTGDETSIVAILYAGFFSIFFLKPTQTSLNCRTIFLIILSLNPIITN